MSTDSWEVQYGIYIYQSDVPRCGTAPSYTAYTVAGYQTSMKIKSFELSHIKAFKSLRVDLERTSVLIGQNDHGKSSILKVIDIVLNQLNDEAVSAGALHPDLAERLLPIFPVKAKARRITVSYDDSGKEKVLHITVRADLTFTKG